MRGKRRPILTNFLLASSALFSLSVALLSSRLNHVLFYLLAGGIVMITALIAATVTNSDRTDGPLQANTPHPGAALEVPRKW
jgi:hypothetical protein